MASVNAFASSAEFLGDRLTRTVASASLSVSPKAVMARLMLRDRAEQADPAEMQNPFSEK